MNRSNKQLGTDHERSPTLPHIPERVLESGAVGRFTTPNKRPALLVAMGLREDPFLNSVSENDPLSDMGCTYIDSQPSLLEYLKRTASTFVFGDYGMGKTATRLAIEYILRTTVGNYPTLCVTYTPRLSTLASDSDQLAQQHLESIAVDLAIDTFVQFVERMGDEDKPPSPEQLAALGRMAPLLPRPLQLAIRAAASDPPADGILWHKLRPVVRRVPVSEPWRILVNHLAKQFERHSVPNRNWASLMAGVAVLGFPRVFLLIDALDERAIDPDRQHLVLRPLLDLVGDFQKLGVFIKCFLPLSLQKIFYNQYRHELRSLTVPLEIATIDRLNPDRLQQTIRERLQVVSSSHGSFRSLDWFQSDEIEGSIELELARLANGSPRRMIELASQLIDFHSRHGFINEQDPGRLWLTPTEWQDCLALMARDTT
ncbi:MAG: hypothetical protein HGA45_12250 [Chloroflexales bacterium]|nr:hypothetical protein [Chloroflexales bacterium]